MAGGQQANPIADAPKLVTAYFLALTVITIFAPDNFFSLSIGYPGCVFLPSPFAYGFSYRLSHLASLFVQWLAITAPLFAVLTGFARLMRKQAFWIIVIGSSLAFFSLALAGRGLRVLTATGDAASCMRIVMLWYSAVAAAGGYIYWRLAFR